MTYTLPQKMFTIKEVQSIRDGWRFVHEHNDEFTNCVLRQSLGKIQVSVNGKVIDRFSPDRALIYMLIDTVNLFNIRADEDAAIDGFINKFLRSS